MLVGPEHRMSSNVKAWKAINQFKDEMFLKLRDPHKSARAYLPFQKE